MAFINVKNKTGTSDKSPPAGFLSWLDFWEKKKDKQANKFEAMLCSEKADLGGHIIKAGEGGKEYILPICYKHNSKSNEEIYQAWDTDLVPVSE